VKRVIFLFIAALCIYGCDKEKEDYRTPYTGVFKFTTVSSTVVMSYDKISSCTVGWEEVNVDTTYITTEVEKVDINRLKIQFGNALIGISDVGDTITQTICPILSSNGDLTLPEYPVGGHNRFIGSFKGYDTIVIEIQYGCWVGGYDKYKIIGVKTNL